MKSIIILFLSFLLLSSCKQKEYTCICQGGFTGGGDTRLIQSSSKSRAEKDCYSSNAPYGTADGFYDCELK
ncbi:MAG: hypothetical protein IT256_01490 [Chitinophagaceae bacterium]|nr:hypothetical protein [Chitinophagaceae bacterium]